MTMMGRDGSIARMEIRNGPKFAPGASEVPGTASPASRRSQAISGKSTMSGWIANRISRFLVDQKPGPFCDDCIADKLGLSDRRQANRVTIGLAKTSAFWRAVGACSVCGRHKQAIRNV